MRSSSKKRWSIAANIILSICSFLAIMPFLLLIIASLTDDTVAMTDGYSYFPAKWQFSDPREPQNSFPVPIHSPHQWYLPLPQPDS